MNLCDVSREQVIQVLQKVELQVAPGLDDIDSRIVADHIAKLPSCSGYPVEKLEIIRDRIRERIYISSSRGVPDPILNYHALLEGNCDIPTLVEINIKRVTRDDVAKIIEGNLSTSYYLSSNESLKIKEPNSKASHRLRRKMACGVIDPGAIDIIDTLRDSAEKYVFDKYHKSSNAGKVIKEHDHVRLLVLNQAMEAKTRCQTKGHPYGTEMLHTIEDRLKEIVEKRPQDVCGYTYEFLKGVAAILTNECKITFSEEPEGGWDA